jgi:hypothetical protein
MCRWLSFHHVWYSVDLPNGMDPPKHPKNEEGKKPRLYLLNVGGLADCHTSDACKLHNA